MANLSSITITGTINSEFAIIDKNIPAVSFTLKCDLDKVTFEIEILTVGEAARALSSLGLRKYSKIAVTGLYYIKDDNSKIKVTTKENISFLGHEYDEGEIEVDEILI